MKINLLLLSCGFMIAFAGGCGGREPDPSFHAAELVSHGRIVLGASLSDDDLVVTLDNRSNEVVSIVDEPLIGLGVNGPRVGLVLQKNQKDVLPCAHLDPPLQEDPPTHLMPGESEVRTINLRVLRKTYCLEAGAYTVRAIYPADSRSPDSSSVISVVFDNEVKAPSL